MTKRYDRELTIKELAALPDEDIDFSDIPEADDAFWANAKVSFPDQPKTLVSMRYDTDLLEWFRGHGKGYQTRMNAVLRSFYEAHKRSPSDEAR